MTLDQIRARQRDCQTYNFGLFNADKLAKEDVPLLLAAVDAVLAELDEWALEAIASDNTAENMRQSKRRDDQRDADKHEHHAIITRNRAARIRATLTQALDTK